MRILWLSWKDRAHPSAGGAEVIQDQLACQLVKQGHQVIILTARFAHAPTEETHNGYKVIRIGGRYSVYFWSALYYLRQLRGWPNIVIDECNTVPFFARFYCGKPTVLLAHQLSRQVWFYEMPVLGIFGYLAEPLYLRLLSGSRAITVSTSSKKDLLRHGFKATRVQIIPEILTLTPVSHLSKVHKFPEPTLLVHGALRSMKQTLHAVQAFELAKEHLPKLRLHISGDGDGAYAKKVKDYIKNSRYSSSIKLHGYTSDTAKTNLMRRCHYIVVCSVKEGWGLIVSEAASQGTPAIVYNVDGLRDAVGGGAYGLLAHPTPDALARAIQKGFSKKTNYAKLQHDAYLFAKSLTPEASFRSFYTALQELATDPA